MIRLEGASFLMGSDSPEALPSDGEAPVREIALDSFYLCAYAVTNAEFQLFCSATGYVTEAEQTAWSFVFRNHVSIESRGPEVSATPWWVRVNGASWRSPQGPGTSTLGRLDHPVVHVSWNDAMAYCGWAGYRLPSEAEWEFAARGGLVQKIYPWGDSLTPGGLHRCNIWQGSFPNDDLGEDGFTGPAPVNAFLPNGYGVYNAVGNVWEWCVDWFLRETLAWNTGVNPVGPPSGSGRVIKGGSYLCHESYCFRYRNAARSSNTPSSSTGNLGFRVARD